MDFKIVSENKNNLMKRVDMTVEFHHSRSATISKEAVQKSVATHQKVPVTHVHVNDVKTGRGSTKAVARVEIYTEPKAKDHSVKEAPKTA